VARKVLRLDATEITYEQSVQPRPKLGAWKEELDRILTANASRPAGEPITQSYGRSVCLYASQRKTELSK
jgi:hypothetical protein